MEPERKGKSPSKPSFAGSMVNFGGVTLNRCVAWLFRPKVFENALHRLRWTISKVWFVCFDIVDGRHPAFTSSGWHSDPLFTRFYTGGAGFPSINSRSETLWCCNCGLLRCWPWEKVTVCQEKVIKLFYAAMWKPTTKLSLCIYR